MSDFQQQHSLLQKLVKYQTLNLRLLSAAGIVWMTHFLQNWFYTPKPLLLVPFVALIIASVLCRRKCRKIKAQLDAIGVILVPMGRWKA